MGDVNSWGGYACVGVGSIWGLYLPLSFACEPKTAFKNENYLKKINRNIEDTKKDPNCTMMSEILKYADWDSQQIRHSR